MEKLNFKNTIAAIFNNVFTLIIQLALIIGLIVFGFKAKQFYNDYVESEQKLSECKEIPDIQFALHNVTEYVGARRKMYFKTQCINTRKFKTFYDNNNKCNDTLIDVSNDDNFILMKDPYEGTFFGSNYNVEWLEYWNYYYDLSKPNLWEIDQLTKTITFNAPDIKYTRTSRSKDYLAYKKDASFLSNDNKALLKMTLKTDELAEQKAKVYFEQRKIEIEKEMNNSLEKFILSFLESFGYDNYNLKFSTEIIQ